ncbi:hypothetical protein D3C76_1096520 [compost metagenome]
MVDTNTGHQRQVGVDHVDGVQTATKTHFEHDSIQRRLLEQPEGRQGTHLEIGQGNLAPRRLDGGEGLAQALITGLLTVDEHPLVVTQQVWRTVHAHLEPLGPQHRSDESAGGALAIGAGNGHHTRRQLAQLKPGKHLLRTFQPHVDGRGVQLFEVGEPLAQGSLSHHAAATASRACSGVS